MWSNAALEDLKRQVAHIARDDADAAARVANRIFATAHGLGTFATGRSGRVAGTYEKSVRGLPYIVAYAREADRIAILHVIHTARDWREGEWPE